MGLSLGGIPKRGEEAKEEKSTHVQLQEQFGGDDVNVKFDVIGEETNFEITVSIEG